VSREEGEEQALPRAILIQLAGGPCCDAQDQLSCLFSLFGPKQKRNQTNFIPVDFSWELAYLDLIKTGFDWALPPPATMMMKDIPDFASGTMASIDESLMNLKVTGMFEAALKVTV
jgi:hypothetical protein